MVGTTQHRMGRTTCQLMLDSVSLFFIHTTRLTLFYGMRCPCNSEDSRRFVPQHTILLNSSIALWTVSLHVCGSVCSAAWIRTSKSSFNPTSVFSFSLQKSTHCLHGHNTLDGCISVWDMHMQTQTYTCNISKLYYLRKWLKEEPSISF